MDTPSKWFGVTYALDRPVVVDKINALVAAGEYPAKLFWNNYDDKENALEFSSAFSLSS